MIDRHDTAEPTTVLLVSQSSDLVRLTSEVVADERPVDLHVVADTDAALAFLERRDSYADAPRTSLVLLNDRGGADGIGFLGTIADEPTLARVPVIVLGTSPQRQPGSNAGTGPDVGEYYDRHANAYVSVPTDREAVADVLRRIAVFWLTTAWLPNRDHPGR